MAATYFNLHAVDDVKNENEQTTTTTTTWRKKWYKFIVNAQLC